MRKKRPIRVSQTLVTLVFAAIIIVTVFIFNDLYPDTHDATPDVTLGEGEKLTVFFLDVGEGDCSVILTPEGKTVMIDTGTKDQKQNVTDQLRSFGVNGIDFLILTHSHSDHTGLSEYIIGRYSVGTLVLPNLDDVSAFSGALTAARSSGAEIIRAVSPHTLDVGSVQLNFVFDGNGFVSDNSNNSIEILLTYKQISILFTGDNEEDIEDYLAKEYKNMTTDVLKVAHHGSDTSTTSAFLEAVDPRYAVISVGTENVYGHPHKSVTDRLESKCEKVFRTDLDGAVKLVTDGKSIKFYTSTPDSGAQKAA